MGKSPKPLTILAHPDIVAWEEVQKLSDQGHVIRVDPLDGVDLILHPAAWRMDTQHRKYVPLSIAAGRKRRYPKEK